MTMDIDSETIPSSSQVESETLGLEALYQSTSAAKNDKPTILKWLHPSYQKAKDKFIEHGKKLHHAKISLAKVKTDWEENKIF
jgi:hypothetical protein